MQQYKYDFLTVVQDQAVKSDCGDISFANLGSNPAIINSSVTLQQGNTLALSANENELDRTIYNVRFDTAGAGTSNLVVIRKIYI
ncbi:MAG: hypothetical protein EBX50_16995 [Chitinophagia bacterium]|nr:hypothetical protein [Chitinophagia bacterium]